MDSSSANWTPAENNAFKEALADVGFNSSNWFQHLTSKFPNKTPNQLRDHVMEQDVLNPQIKEGLRENGRCGSFAEEVTSLESTQMEKELEETGSTAVGWKNGMTVTAGVAVGERMNEEQEKPASRKRNLWTEQEHRLFLMGLNIHGKGNWKSIAKNFVHTRTPTQVASHAQKFFNHHSDQRQRRRHSILDITNPHPVAVSMNKSVNSDILTNFNNL